MFYISTLINFIARLRLKVSPFKIIISVTILTLIGFSLIPKLSVKLNPSNTLPSITVNYSWSGASPYTLERKVTSVLESGFSTLRGIEKISSRSSKNSGYITINFDKYADIEVARFEVATIIRQLSKSLPEDASYPTISVNRPDADEARAFLSYSINAPRPPFEIQETVKTQIEPIIGAISDINEVRVYGARPKEVAVRYEQKQLQALGLEKQDLINAIQRKYNRASLGAVNHNNQWITLAIQPNDENVDWHIPIKKLGNRIVYLDELVSVREQEQEAQNYYRVNGKNAITMTLYATKNANTLTLKDEVEEQLKYIEKNLPEGFTIVNSYDSTIYLQKELNKIYERSVYTLVILLLFIAIASWSYRYLLITVISLIANIGIAFLLYYFLKVEIQLYSLAGITISLGLIIDNTIVMVDHLKHQGNKQVFIPIMASTLTTIGALSVINFLDDSYKLNLIDFAKVIIINLGVSLFIALYLIPALLEKIPLRKRKKSLRSANIQDRFYKFYERLIKILLRFKKWAIVVIIIAFGIPFFMLPQKLEQNDTWYQKTYNSTLGNEWYREHIRPHIDKYLGGSFKLFSDYVFEKAYYGRNEETKLYVAAAMNKGATIHQMNEVFLGLENYLRTFPEINQYISTVVSGSQARMEITFKEDTDDSFPFLLKSHLIRKALDIGAVDWNIYGVGNGFNKGGGQNEAVNFTVHAKGYNYDHLNTWADTLKSALEKHPRIQKVLITDNSFWTRLRGEEYTFSLDKEMLALQGSSSQRFFTQLRNTTLQKQPDVNITLEGQVSPLRFETREASVFDIWHVQNSPLDSLSTPKRFNNVATITKVKEEENIDKEDQEYLRKVKFQYNGASEFGNKFLDKTLDSLNIKLPLGFTFERNNQNRLLLKGDDSYYYFGLLVLILTIIYAICAVLFESFVQPFIILSVIPISFIGVFLAFYLFDFNFDQGGMASFVLLSGITVNASMFILNDFNKLKRSNDSSLQSYIQAFKQKIFPLLLTILSTILGFIPFVKDGQDEVFWFALGIGTIGGLIFSAIGILIYLPVFCLENKIVKN